ncbi:MAG: LamG domain-containing protein [Opitutaceae bacterium]|jgi:hypothetical protein|nr:LamG domain-containing protein [Opitutaceae bacterium]
MIIPSFPRCLAATLALASLTGAALAQTIPSPLVHYTFDEGSGATAANSGSAADGDITLNRGTNTAVSWGTLNNTPSGAGYALSFDGTNAGDSNTGSNVGAGTNVTELTDGFSSLTTSLWVNISGLAASPTRLISVASSGTNGFSFRLENTTLTSVKLQLWVNGASVTTTNSIDVSSGWVFLAVSYDGTATSNNVNFYAGGTDTGTPLLQLDAAARTLNEGSVASLSIASRDYRLRLGSGQEYSGNRSPAGLIDDVRIYDSVLSADQIAAIRMDTLVPVPEPATAAAFAGLAALLLAGLAAARRTSRH